MITTLPKAPPRYDPADQRALRTKLEAALREIERRLRALETA